MKSRYSTLAEVRVPCITQYQVESRSHGTVHYTISSKDVQSYAGVHYTCIAS